MAYQQTLSVGTVLIEEFRILGHLGSGGFANTYLAMDLTLGREVAVKEYFPSDLAIRASSERVEVKSAAHGAQFEWALGRFVREAKTLAKFRHPSVVRVFRVFNANDTAYIVLEFVRGSNMETWLKGLGHLPTQAELDEMLPPLLDALEVVHSAGILHRDIKPANIYIRAADHTPVLLDFGAARYASAGEYAGTTAAIVSKGYSPHEAYATDSRLQGPWTDIYGLAATIYRALSGSAPPESTLRVLEDHCVPAVDLDLPASGGYRFEFLAAIDRALAVLPRDRPQSVAEWRQQLLPSTTALARVRDLNAEPTTMQEWNPISDRPPGATTFDPPNRSAGSVSAGRAASGPSASGSGARPSGAVAGVAQHHSSGRRSAAASGPALAESLASQPTGVRPTGAPIVNRQSQPVGNRTFLIGVALFVAGGVALIGQWFITRKSTPPVEIAAPVQTDSRGISIDANRRARDAESERRRLADDTEKRRIAAEDADRKRVAAEEAERKRIAEAAEKKRLAAEAETKRLAEDAEKKRLAEETARKRIAAEEAERKRAAEEAEHRRLASEAEKKRLAEEAERKRVAAEAEKQLLAEEAEKKRLAEEAERKRIAAEEADRKRLAEEVERKRLAAEAEKKRLAEEAEKRQLAVEAERKRIAAEEADRKRVAEEAERKRLAAQAEKQRLAEEAAKKRLAEEIERKRIAAEEAERQRVAEEAERKRLAAEADTQRLADEAEKKRLAEEAEKRRLAEETARQRKLALEQAASETNRQRAGVEIAAASTGAGDAGADRRESPLTGNYGYDESSRRIGYLKNVQAALQSSKCYQGALTGDVQTTRDALSEFEKRHRGDVMKIDVASASSGDFERWLGWFWRQQSFSCYDKPDTRDEPDPQQTHRRAREFDALRRAREEQEARDERRRAREERKARAKAERPASKKAANQPANKSAPKSAYNPPKAPAYKPSSGGGAGSDLLRGNR